MWIYGPHSVDEALRAAKLYSSRVTIEHVVVLNGREHALANIVSLARDTGVTVSFVDKSAIDKRTSSAHAQGVAARVRTVNAPLDELLGDGVQPGLLMVLDHVQDPRNFGSILRNAAAAGASGCIVQTHGNAPITPVVVKASAGAVFHVPVASVTNIARALKRLNNAGFWTVALTAHGTEDLYDLDFTAPVAFVVGSEGAGLRPLVARHCDRSARISMVSGISSLNVSAASAVALFEASRQRRLSRE